MTTPSAVTANPELDWFSIDDQIWLSWQADGNLLEVHNPVNDIGKPHGLGWIDCTSGKKHRIVSRDPLHIEPSILCSEGCGFHGWVRAGKWVPA